MTKEILNSSVRLRVVINERLSLINSAANVQNTATKLYQYYACGNFKNKKYM